VRLQNNDTANLFRGLYRGLSSPMLNVPLVNAVVFASYGVAKRFLESTHTDGSPLTTAEVAMAGERQCSSDTVCVYESWATMYSVLIQHEYEQLRAVICGC